MRYGYNGHARNLLPESNFAKGTRITPPLWRELYANISHCQSIRVKANFSVQLAIISRPRRWRAKKKLAESRGKEVKEHGFGLVPLAGFELTIEERR
jgi:hypothetical protein